MRTLSIFLSLLVLFPLSAWALYLQPDLQDAPVERLVKNLEEKVTANPMDAATLHRLARVHGMAYAQKANSIKVQIGPNFAEPWFGFEPAHVPFTLKPSDDPKVVEAAKAHLQKAIARYAQVLALDPMNLTAALGHAWCLDQAGEKEKAVAAYRRVLEAGWKKEGELKGGRLGGRYITVEAAGYLIPHLDATKDAAEIAQLTERSNQLKKLPRPITPIAIPLKAGLRVEALEDRAASVAFDADGSRLPQRWTWITPEAAWLVHDRQGTGQIDSGLKLFGNVTFWIFWDHGYQPLAALDDNRDGELADSELRGLALWHDRNGNGRSEPGEVRSLAEHGIVSFSCRSQKHADRPDMQYSPQGVRFRDGSTRPSYDLILESR